MRRIIPVTGIGLLLLFFMTILLVKPAASPPNIILISIDTLRRDHVGIYGYHRPTTPAIDAAAREGVIFKHAYTPAPWTLPAHMSLFTGLPPSVHAVDTRTQKLGGGIQTVTELFRGHGYHTAGFITLPYVAGKYGFSRGFEHFEECFNTRAPGVTDNALRWLEKHSLQKNSEKPFFLFIHFCDVHWPYIPPPGYAEMFGVDTSTPKWERTGRLMFLKKFSLPGTPMPEHIKKKVLGLYDGEIRCTDDHIRRIITRLEKSGAYDNTILAITSDHGEEFKEHNSFGHAHSFYSEVINVPLIIRFPKKIKGGLTVNEPVTTSDIPFTLLALSGLEAPPQFQKYSVDLGRYFSGKPAKRLSGRKLWMESAYAGPKRFALLENGYKYFPPYRFTPPKKNDYWVPVRESLFNIFSDPGDLDNLAGPARTPLLERLRLTLHRWVRQKARGVKLVFSPGRPSTHSHSPAVYTGSIRVHHQPGDLPFGQGFSLEDSLSPAGTEEGFSFNISMGPRCKHIYLPFSTGGEQISIRIRRNGEPCVQESLPAPAPGESITLYMDAGSGKKITLAGDIPETAREKSTLTEKEKKLLESLGYI